MDVKIIQIKWKRKKTTSLKKKEEVASKKSYFYLKKKKIIGFVFADQLPILFCYSNIDIV